MTVNTVNYVCIGKELTAAEAEDHHPFSTDILCAWDYSLATQSEVHDMCGVIGNSLSQKLIEAKQRNISQNRTYLQLLKIYSIRFVGFLLYLAWQSFAFAIIILLTVNQATIIKSLPFGSKLANYSTILVNISLTVIGSITPMVLKYITQMELWDSPQIELNITLFRLFLSNQLNVLLFALSYVLLADPYLFANNTYFKLVRESIQVPYVEGQFECRFDAVEYKLLLLTLTNWVSGTISTIIGGYYPYISGNIFVFNLHLNLDYCL